MDRHGCMCFKCLSQLYFFVFFVFLNVDFQEVNSILQQVVERNRVRRSLSAKRNALQSWRSLVETLLTTCPADLIPAEDRQLIIRDLLLDLHDKVSLALTVELFNHQHF